MRVKRSLPIPTLLQAYTPLMVGPPVGHPLQVAIQEEGNELTHVLYGTRGRYRYYLARYWAPTGKILLFVLHNPSTATERLLDFTLRNCRAIAKAHGYAGMMIVNRYASGRSSDPNACLLIKAPSGPSNDAVLKVAFAKADDVVVAWGNCPITEPRRKEVHALLSECTKPLYCLGVTGAGNPKHPGARGRNRIDPYAPLHPFTLPTA